MKAAIDSNVLFDLLAGDAGACLAAEQVLSSAIGSGSVVVCPVVYAELAAGFDQQREIDSFLGDMGIQIEDFSTEALWRTGEAWRAYARRRGRQVQCTRCGQRFDLSCPACQTTIVWRQHLITDFLIGGHAIAQADLLITRDPGYYRTYFPRLQLVIPGPAVPPSG